MAVIMWCGTHQQPYTYVHTYTKTHVLLLNERKREPYPISITHMFLFVEVQSCGVSAIKNREREEGSRVCRSLSLPLSVCMCELSVCRYSFTRIHCKISFVFTDVEQMMAFNFVKEKCPNSIFLLLSLFTPQHSLIYGIFHCFLFSSNSFIHLFRGIMHEYQKRKEWTLTYKRIKLDKRKKRGNNEPKERRKKEGEKWTFIFAVSNVSSEERLGKFKKCVCVKDRYKNRVVVGWRIIHCEESIYSM